MFPSLFGSITGNPAGLIEDEKTVIQLEWDAPSGGNPTGAFTQGFASGSQYFGIGGSMSTIIQGSTLTLSNANVAIATGAKGFGAGANLSYAIGGSGMDVDVGVSVESVTGIQMSVLLGSVQAFKTTGVINLGLGFAYARIFQVETDWSYTLFSLLQQHVFRLSSIFYVGILSLGIDGTYTSNNTRSSFGVGPALAASITSRVTLGARGLYDSVLGPSFTVSGTLSF